MQKIGGISNHQIFSEASKGDVKVKVSIKLGRYTEAQFKASTSLLKDFLNGGKAGQFWGTFKPSPSVNQALHKMSQEIKQNANQGLNGLSKLAQQLSDHQVLTPRPQISKSDGHAHSDKPAGYPGTESEPRIFTPRPKISFDGPRHSSNAGAHTPTSEAPAQQAQTRPETGEAKPSQGQMKFSNPSAAMSQILKEEPPAGYPGTESEPRVFTPRPQVSFNSPQMPASEFEAHTQAPPAGYPGTESEPRIFTPRPQPEFTSPHMPDMHAAPQAAPEPQAFAPQHFAQPAMQQEAPIPNPFLYSAPQPEPQTFAPQHFAQPAMQQEAPIPNPFLHSAPQPEPQTFEPQYFAQPAMQQEAPIPNPFMHNAPQPEPQAFAPQHFAQPAMQQEAPIPNPFMHSAPQPEPQAFFHAAPQPEPQPFFQGMPQPDMPRPEAFFQSAPQPEPFFQAPQPQAPQQQPAVDPAYEGAIELFVPQENTSQQGAAPNANAAGGPQPNVHNAGTESTQHAQPAPNHEASHSPAANTVLDNLKSFTGQKEYVIGGQLQMRPPENKENLKRELISHLVDQMEHSVKAHGEAPQNLQKEMFFQNGGYDASPLASAIQQNGHLQSLAAGNESLSLSQNDIKQVVRAAHFSFSSRMEIPRKPEGMA